MACALLLGLKRDRPICRLRCHRHSGLRNHGLLLAVAQLHIEVDALVLSCLLAEVAAGFFEFGRMSNKVLADVHDCISAHGIAPRAILRLYAGEGLKLHLLLEARLFQVAAQRGELSCTAGHRDSSSSVSAPSHILRVPSYTRLCTSPWL